MNPDNPYAAPQTVGINAELPLAAAVEPIYRRKLFPRMDTLDLRRLADFSTALRYMRFLWTVFLAIGVGVAIVFFLRYGYRLSGSLLLLLCVVLAFRIYADDVRSERARRFSQRVDYLAFLAVCAAALIGGGILLWRGWEGVGQCLALWGCLFILGVFPLSSYSAHQNADELFGPQRVDPRELTREMLYRTEHRVP